MVVAALVAATASAACEPARPAADREPVEAALAAASRVGDCAAELWRAADLDPEATARLLAIPAAEVAPWGGAARGKELVREVILARAGAAAADAQAARRLALLGDASAEQVALRRERVARSIAGASALCAAADGARNGMLAQRR